MPPPPDADRPRRGCDARCPSGAARDRAATRASSDSSNRRDRAAHTARRPRTDARATSRSATAYGDFASSWYSGSGVEPPDKRDEAAIARVDRFVPASRIDPPLREPAHFGRRRFRYRACRLLVVRDGRARRARHARCSADEATTVAGGRHAGDGKAAQRGAEPLARQHHAQDARLRASSLATSSSTR